MLSEAEQRRAQEDFLKYQKEYNESGDTNILWFQMYPLFVNAIGSNLKKINNHNYIPNFDRKVQDGADRLVKRYIKNYPNYNHFSLITLCYYEAFYFSRKSGTKEEDLETSYDELIENDKNSKKSIDLEDYSDYSYVDDLY